MRTALTDLAGITHPIVLAPMASWSGGRLAAAVSDAGGLGMIGGGYADPEWVDREMREAGGSRVGVGFISWALAERPEALEIALSHDPVAVMLAFGDPTPFVDLIRASGALLVCQATDEEEARIALAAGADVVVAQGSDGGGHVGHRGTLALVPAVVDVAGSVPVVAAGGIADGRGLAAVLALGAAGALIGTRFCATVEAAGPAPIKERLIAASGDDTVTTAVFDIVRGRPWPAGYVGRALRNDFTERWSDDGDGLVSVLDDERDRYHRAEAAGDVDVVAAFAGEGVGLVGDLVPAGDLVARIAADAERACSRLR